MRLLALDTSTPSASLALLTAGGRLVPGTVDPGPRHGRLLVPSIHALLRSADCHPEDLDGVAVGLGPGSYTGLRIGVTAAKTLAFATGARLLPMDSMELIARNAPETAERVSVVADAQRHDLYVTDFQRDGPGSPLTRSGPTRFESLEGWLGSLQPGMIVLGPGLQRLAAPLPDFLIPAEPSWHHPRPSSLIAAAVEAYESGVEADWSLEPLYLRRSAAEDLWEQRKTPRSAP